MAADVPLVSVIVPTFNRAAHLAGCLRSVLRQTHRTLEIIVVDDASTDDTESVVRALRDTRIVYRRLGANGGPAVARNAGIRAARGRFVAFLDSDDRYAPTTVERQIAAVGGFDVLVCGSHTGGRKRVRGRFNRRRVELRDLRKGYWFGGGASSLMGRREVFLEIPFDESLRRDEDWDLLLRMVRCYRIGYLNEPLVAYDDGGHARLTNRLINATPERLEGEMRVVRKHAASLGPFWVNYHLAGYLLAYMRRRPSPFRHLQYAIGRCGIAPVSLVLWHKLVDRLPKPAWTAAVAPAAAEGAFAGRGRPEPAGAARGAMAGAADRPAPGRGEPR